MFHKKIDLRVEILSYLNDKNEIEYYPSCGFPVEVFVINQHAKITLFTTQLLNSTNFVFLSQKKNSKSIPITLNKLLFVGNYSLFDHFGWEVLKTQKNYIVVNTIYLSAYLDIKISHIQNVKTKKNCNKYYQLTTLNYVYPNSVWLERENSEMLNIFYVGSKDSRKLLLDYSVKRGVLLKSFKHKFMSNYYKNYYGVNYISLGLEQK